MSDYGIKVSDDGVDVNNAEPTELVYSSKYSNFKIHSIVNQTIVCAAGYHTTTVSVDNPLPYPPMFMAFIHDSNQSGWWHEVKSWYSAYYYANPENNILAEISYNPTTDKFDIKIITYAYFPGGTYTVKIAVFVDNILNNVLGIPKIGDRGIKVSKDNKSVISDVDSDMSLDSKYRNLTILTSSTAKTNDTTPYNNEDGVVTIDHNLGYIPFVFCFQHVPGESYYQRTPSAYGYGPGAQDASIAFFKVNSSQLVIRDQGYYTGSGIDYSYIIFNEQLV